MSDTRVVSARLRVRRVDAMPRDRLLRALTAVWRHRLTLVLAPAGSGKTTLLSQFVAGGGQHAAWYRAEASDGDPAVFLAHLEAATRSVLGELRGPWRSAADAADALERAASERLLLVIDDLHALQHSAAETELARLLEYLPDGVAVLAASRAEPALDLSRLRVGGALLEIGADALRFRSWEVEQLFRDFYREPLAPEELTELARRTDGWAAALQLFHIATRGKSREHRRRTLAGLSTHARLTREYLARNVLHDLDDSTRTFLVRSSVLGRLNGPVCDRFLGRRGSATLLTHLERRQLFTHALEEDGWYRYHEVLRVHLEAALAEEIGDAALRQQRQRAGELLEEAHAHADAIEAYCRAEHWDGAARLLGVDVQQPGRAPGWWVDALPAAVVERDPWMMLATARRHALDGWLQGSVDTYRRAESAFADAATAEVCRRERCAVEVWRNPDLLHAAGWSGQLRAATMSAPGALRERLEPGGGSAERLVAGIAALLAGDVRAALETLSSVRAHAGCTPSVRVLANFGRAVAALLGEEEVVGVEQLDQAVDEAERSGMRWLARLGHDATGLVAEAAYPPELPPPQREGWDPWGPALGALLHCWGEVRRGGGEVRGLQALAATFRSLDASVLEAWARALGALVAVRRAEPHARDAALQAGTLARAAGAGGAQAVALLALAEVEGGDPAAALAMAGRIGLRLPRRPEVTEAVPVAVAAPSPPAAPLTIACLGRFRVLLAGRRLDLGAARPRVRSLLRLLSLSAPGPVHREVIVDALWPEADAETGTRSLQVAVSALRQLLEPGVARSASSLVRRDGEAYSLHLDAGSSVDVRDFDALAGRGRKAFLDGDAGAAVAALGGALDLYRGDLLPEEGPTDWVVKERERYRAAAVDVAATLAAVLERAGDPAGCAAACERGLGIDPYRDCLWRRLIDARVAAGDHASAARARQGYVAMLSELGIPEAEAHAGSPSRAPVESALSGGSTPPVMLARGARPRSADTVQNRRGAVWEP